ncbi:MAG: energy coupling factor transporter S component ThiW [Lachnospiraceae bacterium]|nr:energy coupling factor transporter S component ThiW [Lachnospiraceae bacterium]
MNKKRNVKKLVFSAMLACLSYVVSSFVYFPRMAPFQHMFNVIAAVFVGPYWGFVSAGLTGLMRMILGGRTIQAFVGAVVGAFLSGILYRVTKNKLAAAAGEIFGTGILSAIMVYPLMVKFYGLAPELPFWTFIPSYVPSSVVGACLGVALMKLLEKAGLLARMKQMLEE